MASNCQDMNVSMKDSQCLMFIGEVGRLTHLDPDLVKQSDFNPETESVTNEKNIIANFEGHLFLSRGFIVQIILHLSLFTEKQ